MSNTLLEAALEYARRGWHVFPCGPNGKRPLTAHGHTEATTDELEIQEAWRLVPEANIAIATGTSGLVVLDVDRDGAIREFIDKAPEGERDAVLRVIGSTLRASTGRPGAGHIYFRAPAGVEIRSKTKVAGIDGLDVRAAGGYVITPPSLHANGAHYRWINAGADVLELPTALIPLLQARVAETVASAEELCDTINTGKRNDAAFRTACTLVRQGLNENAIISTLTEMRDVGIIEHSKSSPFTDTEIHRVAASAVKTVLRSADGQLDAVWASDVQDHKVEYVWQPYLPHGMLTVLAGVQGDGKTFVACDIAARITRGEDMPRFVGQKRDSEVHRSSGRVLYVGEDPDYVIKTRLSAASADLSRVRIIRGRTQRRGSATSRSRITIEDFPLLQREIEQIKPDLVVIDPVQSFTGGKINMNQANEVRSVLNPLMALADERGFTLIIICHTSKAQQSHAIFKVLGSVDFTAAARSVLFVVRENGETGLRALVHVKSSNAPEGASLRFGLEGVEMPRVCWKGFSALTKTAINAPERSQGRGRPAVGMEQIKERIREAASHKRGPAEEASILADVRGATQMKKAAFREMVRDGELKQMAGGGKGDPYLYNLENAGSKNPSPELTNQNLDPTGVSTARLSDTTQHFTTQNEKAVQHQNAGSKNKGKEFTNQHLGDSTEPLDETRPGPVRHYKVSGLKSGAAEMGASQQPPPTTSPRTPRSDNYDDATASVLRGMGGGFVAAWEARRADVVSTLDTLAAAGKITVRGSGVRGNPKHYALADSIPDSVPNPIVGTRERNPRFERDDTAQASPTLHNTEMRTDSVPERDRSSVKAGNGIQRCESSRAESEGGKKRRFRIVAIKPGFTPPSAYRLLSAKNIVAVRRQGATALSTTPPVQQAPRPDDLDESTLLVLRGMGGGGFNTAV